MVMPENLFVSVKKIQDTILICAPVVSQYAAAGALRAGAAFCREKLKGITAVRELVLDALEQISELCAVPRADGAFYFLLRIHSPLNPMDLTERLIREHGVAVIPGTTFGMDHRSIRKGGASSEPACYVRISYGALQTKTAAEGIGRLVTGLKTILCHQ
jgi:aspartate/methionine/tyrosine aminotransferase